MSRWDRIVSPILILLALLWAGAGFEWPTGLERSLMVSFSLIGFGWLGFRFFKKWIRKKTEQIWPRFFIASGVLLCGLALYGLNPMYEWIEGSGPKLVAHLSYLPSSTFMDGAWQSVCLASVALVIFGLSMSLGRKAARGLRLAVLAAATVTALITLGQRVTPMAFPVYKFTGFFGYENHYAAFANLVLPVALFFAARQRIEAFHRGLLSSPDALTGWASGMLVASVMVSGSRAGFAISIASALFFVLWMVRFHRRVSFAMPQMGGVAKVGFIVGILFAAGMAIYGVATGWSHVGELTGGMAFRGQIVRDALVMGREFWVWGTGPGSFTEVFPYYRDLTKDHLFISHVHCDPVEFLVEFGVLGSALVLGICTWVLMAVPRRRPERSAASHLRRLEWVGLLTALVGVFLHSLIDFPFHHPLIALLAVTWAGMLVGQCSWSASSDSRNSES